MTFTRSRKPITGPDSLGARWQRHAAAVAVVVLLPIVALSTAGTASAQSATPGPTTTTGAPPPTTTPKPRIKAIKKPKLNAVQQAATNLPPSGLPTKESALRLFALTFGPVPGLNVKKSKVLAESATDAIEGVNAHLSEYTPAQQQAIRQRLQYTVDGPTFTIPPVQPGAPAAPVQPAAAGDLPRATFVVAPVAAPVAAPKLQDLAKLAATFREEYAQRLGFDFPGTFYLHLASDPGRRDLQLAKYNKSPGLAWAEAHVDKQNLSDGCNITMLPFAADLFHYSNNFIMAHEVFHCFQFAINGKPHPKWLEEGSAEWAASVLTNFTSSWWKDYLTTPGTALFTRSYDALGFFAQLADSGVDPFTKIDAMYEAADSAGAYVASGAPTSTQFNDTWASSYLRSPQYTAAWNANGPGIPSVKLTPKRITIAQESSDVPLKAAAYANSLTSVHVVPEVLEVTATGHVRVSDGTVDQVVSGVQEFCTKPGGCGCPGSSGANDPTPVKKDLNVAVTGGTDGAQATLTGVTVKDACCSTPATTRTVQGLTIIPRIRCTSIGLTIAKQGGLAFAVDYTMLVDKPRLVPRLTKKGKLVGLDLQGVKGIKLTIEGGSANPVDDNGNFNAVVPIEVEVPVIPAQRNVPRTMKVTWKVIVKTAFTGNNATLSSKGLWGLSSPLGLGRDKPTLGTAESILENLDGISFGPSGFVVAVQTRFEASSGAPAALKKAFAALTTSVGITNGSAFGSPLVLCKGATLDVDLATGGAKLPEGEDNLVHREQVVPNVPLCVDSHANATGQQ